VRLVTPTATFRANPEYEIVVLDRLPEAAQLELRTGDDAGDVYGALVPREGSALEPLAISAETALLAFTLATPAALPAYVVERLGEDVERTVRRLVVDGVLEVLHEGGFVSGPRVAELLAAAPAPREEGRDRKLAVAALRYGQALDGLSRPELALRLYCYGRRPLSPALTRRLPDADAVAAWLGLGSGPLERALRTRWLRVPAVAGAHEHWWQWMSPSARPPESGGFKLYVSPGVDDLPQALQSVAAVLATARGVTGLKLGAGLAGICRPDKLIVYFAHVDELRSFAAALTSRLAGCSAHGVPFTAAVAPDLLLCWGADPPRPIDGRAPTSWRMWVAERLAEHLLTARSADLGRLEPWQFALERLRLGGIETDTWTPTGGMWPEALVAG
jgi:hypothetical protein